MWKQKFKNALEYLKIEYRVCLFCGSLANEDELLCAYCWRFLGDKSKMEFLHNQVRGFDMYSLFKWKKDEDVLISMLTKALKNNSNSADWEPLAQMFVTRLHEDPFSVDMLERLENAILVPAPASNPLSRNHAEHFALALSRKSGIPLQNGLRSPLRSAQKHKQRRERSLTSMTWDENFSIEARPFILVDDIVTTGSTAWAAFEALNRPAEFAIWCVARRSPNSSV